MYDFGERKNMVHYEKIWYATHKTKTQRINPKNVWICMGLRENDLHKFVKLPTHLHNIQEDTLFTYGD